MPAWGKYDISIDPQIKGMFYIIEAILNTKNVMQFL